MSANLDLESFRREGYLRLRNVFSLDEIAGFRRKIELIRARAISEKNVILEPRAPSMVILAGDVLGMKELKEHRYIIFDDRVLSIAKGLLGEQLVYFGDSSIQTGEGIRGYHKDNIDRYDPTGPDWKGDYTLIQFGIYLQDHARNGGGLKLRLGSHQIASRRVGKPTNVPSEIGDVLVWNSRTTHSGNSVRLKTFPDWVIPPLLENFIPRFLRISPEQERMVVFVTFGAPGPHVDRYIGHETTREDCREFWKRSCVDGEVRSLADSHRIELRQPIPEYGSLHPLHQPASAGAGH